MYCLFCGSDQSKVVNKRSVVGRGEIRRRRECLKCHRRFTTYEKVASLGLFVIKRNGQKEAFDKSKLQTGLEKALEKRYSLDKICLLADKIERRVRAKGKNEIASKTIGQLILSELKRIDKVAYLRFASVYRRFEEPSDFARELQGL